MHRTLLDKVDIMHRKVLVVHRLRALAWHGAVAITAVAALIMIDWLVRWPWPIRAVTLLAAIGFWVRTLRSTIRSHWTHAPSMQAMALRLERLEPELAGRLASAVQFQAHGAGVGQRMADEVIDAASDAWNHVRPERHLRWMPGVRAMAAYAGAIACVLLVTAWRPEFVRVGLCRALTPWTADRWPSRVELSHDTLPQVVARGGSLPLKARVVRGDDDTVRVQATCTIQDAAGRLLERRIDLARQPDGSFERSVPAEGDRMTIMLVAEDASTEPESVRVMTPPSVIDGSIQVTPPAYASGMVKPSEASWKGTNGGEHTGILEGSLIELQCTLAAPAAAPDMPSSVTNPPVLQVASQGGGISPEVVMVDPTHWRMKWVVRDACDITLAPRDAEGLQAPEPLRITLRTVPDRPPSVSVTDPSGDEIVTSLARMPFKVEARDDLQLQEAGWRVDRQQRSGESAPVSMRHGARQIESVEASIEDTLDLPSLQVRAGDVLLLRGMAVDGWTHDGVPRDMVLSEPRRIRVVDAPTLERQVRQQVDALRQVVSRLEQAQEEVGREKDAESGARSQMVVSERIRQASQAASRLAGRMKQNGLEDQTLTESLQEASDAGRQADDRSVAAVDALRRSMKGDQDAATQASEAQAGVRDELRRMGEALDRDDRSAGAQRRAERIARQIDRLREDLREVARGTEGRIPEELDDARKRSLQEQAGRQRMVADEVRAMLDELHQGAEKARSGDRTQSKSLQQAAEEGERGQAARRMDEAGDRTERNQTTAADQSMQAAAEAMERVQSALREDRRARTEDLKRRMGSLIETLKGLAAECDRIVSDVDGWLVDRSLPTTAVESALILVARNTASAVDEAQEAGASLRKAAGLVQRALERQQAALASMRSSPVAGEEAREATNRAATLLREAVASVEEARKRESAKTAERERRQLEKVYRELAARVMAVRQAVASTLPPPGAMIDRRGSATQREQGAVLQDVQVRFEQGPMASETVGAAETFRSVHTRIHEGLARAGASLREAAGDGLTVRQLDEAGASLTALADALKDPEAGDDPFLDGQQQASGGAGSGAGEEQQGLPPIAELRVVRELQAHVNRVTHDLAEAAAAGQSVDESLREAGRMQDEIRRLGEDWIQRMDRRKRERGAPESPTSAGSSNAFGRPWQSTPDQTTVAPPPPSEGGKAGTSPSQTPPRSLDDLLGISEDSGASEAARQQQKERLDRSLRREDLDDLAKSATESMQLASRLMQQQADGGLGTQRAQAKALADLDALIDAASRFQKQQGSKSSSRSSNSASSKSSNRSAGGAQAQANPTPAPGDRRGASERNGGDPQGKSNEMTPPTDASVKADGTLEEGRSEWGGLPPRVREILSQSRRDRISALYQQATENYYRRLAEERKP